MANGASQPVVEKGPRGQVTPKMLRYAQRLIEKYDVDADGRLTPEEWRAMGGEPRLADYDRDGFLVERELARRVADYGWHRAIRLVPPNPEGSADETGPAKSEGVADANAASGAAANEPAATVAGIGKRPAATVDRRRGLKFYLPAGRLPSGLPEWFHTRDADGDGQLTLKEYSPQALKGEIDQYAQLDQNGDGVLTASEYQIAAKALGANVAPAVQDSSAAPAATPIDEIAP